MRWKVFFTQFSKLENNTYCPNNQKYVFEWVHFLLFFFVVLYIISVISLIIFQLFMTRRWKKYDELGYEYIRRRAGEIKKNRQKMNPALRYLNFVSAINYAVQTSFTNYGMLRKAVIVRTGMPDYFLFSIYMKYGLRAITIKLVNIHFSVYAIVIVIAWLNYIREELIISFEPDSDGSNAIVLILGALLVIMHVCLYILVSGLQKRCIKKENEYLKSNKFEENNAEIGQAEMKKVRHFLKANQDEDKKTKHHDKLMKKHKTNCCANPKILIPLIQMTFLLSSFYIGICLYFNIVNKVKWYWWIAETILCMINAAISPAVLFSLVKSMYCGDMIDYRLLLKSWDKQYSNVKKNHLRFRADEDGIVLDNFKREHQDYKAQIADHAGDHSHSEKKLKRNVSQFL